MHVTSPTFWPASIRISRPNCVCSASLAIAQRLRVKRHSTEHNRKRRTISFSQKLLFSQSYEEIDYPRKRAKMLWFCRRAAQIEIAVAQEQDSRLPCCLTTYRSP